MNVDPAANRTEAVLYPAEGGSAIAGPLQRGYLAKIKELLGPLDLFLCTSYTTQPSYTTGKNTFSFLLADRSERRAIMGEMLGLGQYAIRHAASRDRIRAIETKLNGLRVAQGQWEADLGKRPEAQKRVDETADRLAVAQQGLAASQKALEEAQESLREAKTAKTNYGPYRAQRDVLGAELTALRQRLKSTETALETARAGVAAALAQKDAPAQKEGLQAQLAELRPAELQLSAVAREIEGLELEVHALGEEVETHQAILNRAPAIEAAVITQPEIESQIARLEGEIDESQASDEVAARSYNAWISLKEGLKQQQSHAKDLQQAVSLMDQVPCKGEERFAGCQFLVNAAQAKEDLPAVANAVAELEEVVGPERAAPVSATPALKNQLARFRADRAQIADLVAEASKLDVARSRVDGLHDQIDGLNRRLSDQREVQTELTENVSQIPQLRRSLEALEPAVVVARSLGAHQALAFTLEANLEDIQHTVGVKDTELLAVQGQLVGADDVDARVTSGDVTVAKAANEVRQAQTTVITLEREVGVVSARLQALDEVARRLAKTQDEIQAWGVDSDDWTLLAHALSPSGIPALLIDQALPEISALATDFLQECLGESLFSIALTTQRAAANDKKMLEVLDVLVFRDGQKIAVEHLSGGEGVLVSEALSIAIDLYNARRPGGKRRYTLFRDEVGANLDILRAPAYSRLLARAIKLGGYSRCLFVSHHAEALAVADARIGIANGQCTIT